MEVYYSGAYSHIHTMSYLAMLIHNMYSNMRELCIIMLILIHSYAGLC